jgi:hypothetical protein
MFKKKLYLFAIFFYLFLLGSSQSLEKEIVSDEEVEKENTNENIESNGGISWLKKLFRISKFIKRFVLT